jgi:hypothetical protein
MTAGFAVFAALSGSADRVVETYPHGVFRRLAGGPVPSKQTPAGHDARVAALGAAGVSQPGLAAWSHDSLDAMAAALVAHRVGLGRATSVSCGHAGSAIWLP